ncbi:acetylcholine receptor subunit alpha-like [Mercenaria mercenaria]|uniref:acetylcholine receptor subunit alpha-like n=1 Tax=Mercenaria mercenaria TaxID=6596 RepID=UPI00234EFDE2|nr:acetylcholine receptor subunit alpha-like [Mercenaria mercenaria]
MECRYVLFLSKFFLCLTAAYPEYSESFLLNNLFKDYNPNVRPVLNYSYPIIVSIGLELRKIQHLDEIRQSLKTTVSTVLYWKDELLTWRQTQYHGISSIEFPFNKQIWTPDVMIYNALDKPGEFGMKDAFVRLYSNGQIFIWTMINIDTACEVKTKTFPYDVQTCKIDIGKFISSDKKVAIKPLFNEMDMRFYVEIAEWDITENYVTTRVVTYNESFDTFNDSSEFTFITYNITMRRSCKLCFFNIILPVLVLAVLDLLSFFVPCESGEKTSYPLSMFLTLAVFLTMITQSLPESIDGISYLSSYVTFQLAISAITLMSAVISLHLHHRMCNNTRVSRLARFASYISKCGRSSSITKRKHIEENCPKIKEQDETENTSSITERGTSRWMDHAYVFDRLMFFFVLLCQIIGSIIFIEGVFN